MTPPSPPAPLAPSVPGPPAADETAVRGAVHVVRSGVALLRAEVQARSAYRAQILLGSLGWVVPLAFLALWRDAAADGPVGGITAAGFTTYFAVLLAMSNLWLTGTVVFATAGRVHSGQLSAMLLRPAPPLLVPVAEGLATNVFRLPVVLVGVPVLVLLGGGAVTSDPADWLLAPAVGVVGIVAVTYVASLVACVAFWMTKAQGVMGLVIGLEWVLGGMVAPVALMPGPLPALLVHQPFWYAGGAPAEILAGIGDHGPTVLLEALAWVLVLHLLLRVVWRRGLRRYEAVGS
ncbi:ABC-2 family transporter protein [Cellulomonas phragmiteti]|uniref:ABC transporter permease n=1 Tax=Cellulomonas phragmiteti TaxID=478780 RepID=A0ABQ4DR36_9CELL|nr:ABC-2 family transporter protein [Cellulomonas phragmiteti]GIG41803.1 ABC transporter permease [Cellulomonas phragmiteti]